MGESPGMTIKVLSHEYAVLLDKDFCDNEKVMGQCRFLDGQIFLKPDLGVSALQETLVHEIVEAVIYHMGVKVKHGDINRLSEGFASILRDNDVMGLFDQLRRVATAKRKKGKG